jgi:sporulation protein YlmC with PRC-barrel domain
MPGPTAPGGTTAGQPSGGSGPGTGLTRIEAASIKSGWRASKMMGMDVYDTADRKIGNIDDLIVTRNERVPVAVLSVGGFLGIGSKLVAVPFQELRLVGDDRLTLPGATEDSLKALP